MPRKKLIETTDYPFHITNRSNNKEFFYLPIPILWEIMIKKIRYLDLTYSIKTHAFLLMSNHYHWILSTPKLNLSKGMTYFHREVARNANKECKRINHFFGGRYKWSLIEEETYYWNSIKYLYRNPVKAGICKRVQDYTFSSLTQNLQPKLWQMTDYFNDPQKEIQLNMDWLNKPFSAEQDIAIQKALRRRVFKTPCNKNRKTVALVCCGTKRDLVPVEVAEKEGFEPSRRY